MLQLQTRLGDADLIQPNRVFIKEGKFSLIKKYSDTGKHIRLILFSDALIVAKVVKDFTTKCKLLHKIPLVEAKVEVYT